MLHHATPPVLHGSVSGDSTPLHLPPSRALSVSRLCPTADTDTDRDTDRGRDTDRDTRAGQRGRAEAPGRAGGSSLARASRPL